MKTKYLINSIGWSVIILLLACLSLTSCKKEENKAPITSTPVVAITTVDKYIVTSYGTNSFNVNDTISLINTGTALKLTIPVQYGLDTMTLSADYGAQGGATHSYGFNHILKMNTYYYLDGAKYVYDNNTITLVFNQKLVSNNSTIQAYNLQYTKI